MPETETEQVKSPMDQLIDILSVYQNPPDEAQLLKWKNDSPTHKVRYFSPDRPGSPNQRGFIFRGLTMLEWVNAQKSIPAGVPETDIEIEVQIALVCKACIWTSATGGQLTPAIARLQMGAGFIPSVMELVGTLSDYVPPHMIQQSTIEI